VSGGLVFVYKRQRGVAVPAWRAGTAVPVLQQRFESQRRANRRVLGDASTLSGRTAS
jgi:hypothetical protein